MYDLSGTISVNLAVLRRQRGLSLDKLAEMSGVSKAMIGQIERGDSNPTVNTLWKIAAALHVPLSRLTGETDATIKLVRFQEIVPFHSADGLLTFPLFPFDQQSLFEAFHVQLDAACSHQSEPHEIGSVEHVFLECGTLEIEIDSKTYPLATGDALRFPSDRPHTYRNTGSTVAVWKNLIHYQQ